MKIKSLSLCIAAIMISSCAPTQVILSTAVPNFSPSSTSMITPGVLTSSLVQQGSSAFVPTEPETYVKVLPAVLEYFYYRKNAMISGHVEDLWTQFPELRNGSDPAKGINAESSLITNYQGLKLFDGNIFPEYYEQMRVKTGSDEMQVLVHGMELYLYPGENGQFNQSGG